MECLQLQTLLSSSEPSLAWPSRRLYSSYIYRPYHEQARGSSRLFVSSFSVIGLLTTSLMTSNNSQVDLPLHYPRTNPHRFRSFSLPFLPREAFAVLPRQVVCRSVRPSVTLRYRDDIDWNSGKIISRLISLYNSLSEYPNLTDLLQREHPKF